VEKSFVVGGAGDILWFMENELHCFVMKVIATSALRKVIVADFCYVQ
jgi:beta-galactosidase beta subunit